MPTHRMAPPDITSPRSFSSSHSDSNNGTYFQSNLGDALRQVPVPKSLLEGVPLLRVSANGKIQAKYLSLSQDKFTLCLANERGNQRKKTRKSWISFGKSRQNNDSQSIDIGSIQRIQRGAASSGTKRFEMSRHRQNSFKTLTSHNSSSTSPIDENGSVNATKSFSIIFRGDWTLDLILMADDIKRDDLLDVLDRLLTTYQCQKKLVSNEVLLMRYTWLNVVSNKENSHYITNAEFSQLLARISYPLKRSQLNEQFEKFGKVIGLDRKRRKEGLTLEQACTLLHKLKRDSWVVKPINLYWNKLFGEHMNNGKERKNVSDRTFFEKFLWEQQGETHYTLEGVQRLFVRLNALEVPRIAGDSQGRDPSRIDKSRFEAYLLGADNEAFDPARERFEPKSMHRPISEYWINSSHNTYLTGDQFTSNSSVEMYSNALYRGCRCLELDIWDGDIDGGVPRAVVWHGHTMTSKILFRDIIKTVKLFLNFHPDTFPLILSFENHCTVPYQEAIADELLQILGKSLYIPTESSLNAVLPSPSTLRGMVVIKGRRPDNLDLDDYYSDDDVSDDGAPSTIFSGDTRPLTPKKVHHGVCPALARLTLFHGCKLTNWDASVRNLTHHMHSFSESKIRSLARRSDRRKWTIYNQSHMSRTYPAGSRVDSSNYSPILPWSVGCQMVSLNFQTNDAALRLNDGRFRENGGCGYVLKDHSLLEMHKSKKEPRKPLKITIRVLSASCLPKPKEQRVEKSIDPYVRVSMFDVKNGDKEISSSYQTAVVYNNGFFPIWTDEQFTFFVENPSVAMIQFSIYDKEGATSLDDFIASASIPISCLRRGLRSVKLFDVTNTRSGAFDFASLLVEVKKGSSSDGTSQVERPFPMSQRSSSVPEEHTQQLNRAELNRARSSQQRRPQSMRVTPSHRRTGSGSLLAEF